MPYIGVSPFNGTKLKSLGLTDDEITALIGK